MATFPENEVEVIRDYLGTSGAKPSEKIETVRTALGSVLGGIQEHNPFPPP